MNHSYFLIGIKPPALISMIRRNGGFSFKFIPRVFLLLMSGIWSSLFALIQKRRFSKLISTTIPAKQPIFIIGHWRTGTTYLHQLISVDNQFATPSVFQVSVPDGFMVSRKYYYPIMKKALGDKRPIDNVKIGFDEPQEDEYALLKLVRNSPLERLIFPANDKFFLNDLQDYIPSESDKTKWKKELESYYRKLYLDSGKQIVFKNPFHSMRISFIREVFPEAKFIHIYRDPEKVVPSAIRMWDIVGRQNVLRNAWRKPDVRSVAECYKRILLHIRSEASILGSDNYAELKFEELESAPIQQIRKVYDTLKLDFSDEYAANLEQYISELKAYQKSNYHIDEQDRKEIKSVLSEILTEYYD